MGILNSLRGAEMKKIYSEIKIDASAARAWEILIDFPAYPEWNPFIPEISGDLRVGSMLKVHIQPPGSRGMTFKPKLLRFEPEHEIRWLGRLFIAGLVDGEHALAIKKLEGDRVLFSQSEEFRGLIVPFLSGIVKNTAKGFEEMNGALKERAESAGD